MALGESSLTHNGILFGAGLSGGTLDFGAFRVGGGTLQWTAAVVTTREREGPPLAKDCEQKPAW